MNTLSFALRLKLAIGSRSARDVADEAGCSAAAISRLLRGGRRPHRHIAFKLAAATHVKFDWLYMGDGPMQEAPSPRVAKLRYRDCRRCKHHIDAANYGSGKAHDLCGHPNVRVQGHAVASAPLVRGLDNLCARGAWYAPSPLLIPRSA
jgi:transcriptional regulator with XRE-family HTH domain